MRTASLCIVSHNLWLRPCFAVNNNVQVFYFCMCEHAEHAEQVYLLDTMKENSPLFFYSRRKIFCQFFFLSSFFFLRWRRRRHLWKDEKSEHILQQKTRVLKISIFWITYAIRYMVLPLHTYTLRILLLCSWMYLLLA